MSMGNKKYLSLSFVIVKPWDKPWMKTQDTPITTQ